MKTAETATGEIVSVKGVGSITLKLKIDGKLVTNTITGVEYIPDMDYNLIGTGLLESKNCEVTAKHGRLIITDLDDNTVFMTGTRQDPSEGNSYKLNLWEELATVKSVKSAKSPVSWTQWHRRLGHLNMGDVRKLASWGLFDGSECNRLSQFEQGKCEACMLGKMHRTPNHSPVRSQRRATRKGQRFHVDLAGGGNIIMTPSGKRYAIIIIDDYTDYTWLFLARKKNEMSKILREFVLMIEAQGIKIECFRLDNAKENINAVTTAFMKEHGIQWEPTVPDNPHQNGVAERAFRTIFNRVRACLIDSKLPKTLWGEACHMIVDLKNISPCTLLAKEEKKTPHEAWSDIIPDLSNLHPFGTLCYANRENAMKLEDQGVKCRLLGYEASNQYRLWDVQKRQIIRAAHVTFDEFTTPPQWEGADEDFNYVTLDFFMGREPAANEAISTDTTVPPEVTAPVEPTADEPVARPEEAENVENDDIEEEPPTPPSPQPAADNAESPPPASPAPPAEPEARPRRGKPSVNYALSSNPWNPRIGGNIKDPGNQARSKGFSIRIRRVRTETKYKIPQTWEEAMTHVDSAKWFEAAQEEYNNQTRNRTWRVIIPELHEKVIGGRWVFNLKYDTDGNITRFKARWVAQGFRQVKGLDYNEIFSGVVKSMIWKALLALAAKYDLEAHHIDIVSAFLEANVKERILVKQPPGFEYMSSEAVCELNKALYGLKQSSREWYDTLKEFLLSIGYTRLQADHSVFVHRNGVIIAVYVDDLLIVGPHASDIKGLKESISKRFKIKDLNEVTHYLGVKVVRDRANKTMWLTQTAFIKKLVDDCGLTDCRPVSTPMEPYPLQADMHNGQPYKASPVEVHAYQEILGSLQWLVTMTRQDIAYPVNKLAQFTLNPTPTHMTALQRIVKYLAGTSELGIRFGPDNSEGSMKGELTGYTDASYINDVDTKRSHSGYVFMLWNGPISCSSKRQDTIATSSTEAEYIGQCNAAKEAYFLSNAFDQLGYTPEGPIELRADNQSAIKLANNPVSHARSKHYPIQYHYVREQVAEGNLRLEYISTNDMVADGLTKALKKDKFQGFVKMLGLTKSGNSMAA